MQNAVYAIRPYRYQDMWVFDDARVDLELAGHYYIQGEHSERKFIPLNPDLFVCEFEC